MNVMPTLIRREFWEHRQLWIMPLVIAGLFIAILALFPHANVQMDDSDFSTPHKQLASFAIFHSALAIPQFLLLAVLLPFYLLDCLYAERKDRSILFWKALPVSDAQTVLSKLLVALVVVPLGVYVLTVCTDIAASGILAVRLRESEVLRALVHWDTGVWLRTQGLILASLVVVVLWYAPIAGYLLLISAWAKRNAFLWALLPPPIAMLVEKIAFRTTHLAHLLGYRLGASGVLGVGHGVAAKAAVAGDDVPGMMDSLRPLLAYANVDLWLGLAVTVAFVWAVIRIRRHQDVS
jgi:ABC-2 type transport system permease protein